MVLNFVHFPYRFRNVSIVCAYVNGQECHLNAVTDTHYSLHLCSLLCFAKKSTVCLEMHFYLCNHLRFVTWGAM